MSAQSTLVANSLNLDGRAAAAGHCSFFDTLVESTPHSLSTLQSSNGSGNFTDEADNSTIISASIPVEESIHTDTVQASGAQIGAVRTEEKEHEEVQVNCSTKCVSEEVPTIDHTELINNDENGSKRNWKQQEAKEKKPRRRGGKCRRNNSGLMSCNPVERREKKGLMYSRGELEALRFDMIDEQKKKWFEIYCRLGPAVVDEYDGLLKLDTAREKDSIPGFDFDPRPQFQKYANLVCPKDEGDHLDNLNESDPSSFPPISDERGSSAVEEDYCEDDDSDEEYSIQRPAFSVTGEPDFDSGPPLDGLEYLRRVRWEAARIPKVKVVKVNKVKEQSVYMPQIPDVIKCPEKLLPLKQWEDSFLSDFSQLREAFARLDLEDPSAETSTKEEFLNQMVESDNTSEKYVSLESIDGSCISETTDANSSPSSPQSSIDLPTLSAILKMDSAARTSLLKKRVNSVLNVDILAYKDSLWLFALCVALDWPLHADTSAALRSLLRKCASLRAAKTEVDDQVIALNILVTITGKYFGQLERE
ncbi:hypothetical protein SASPL_101576 [Salvia splendens]|uniref:Survival of motor neuron protein-interacting protein 1 n=1 Tax=Salvia splendens TaxID=180675 RepID=A0A8X8YS39_SALSN|nr:uncharacterized protein LOC121796872 [Salvia splendens]KAG6436674.1 hypothetical protein SASPL_101576 [Salvia splendens]